MKVRLRDWASLNCISERTVQIHIKENQEELEGHIERKGKQGTWLDEFAQDFLIEKIQLPNRQEVYQPTARESALLIELSEANKRAAEAEREARINAEAVGRVKLLEANNEDQKAQIIDLSIQIGGLKEKCEKSTKEAQDLSDELSDTKKDFKELKERNEITENNLKSVQERLKKIENTWYYKLFGGKKE